jgi:FkbM family methyltransferase
VYLNLKGWLKTLLSNLLAKLLFNAKFLNLFQNSELLMKIDKFESVTRLILASHESLQNPLIGVAFYSKSQFSQDLFALSSTGFKRNGYFVEFGATDGVEMSNTYLLEKHYSWTGILAEPARIWHSSLSSNRKVSIETCAVDDLSGKLVEFAEDKSAMLSGLIQSSYAGKNNSAVYQVSTISLNDLLAKYSAPKHIDYMSIDTEGSELQILENFSFSQHSFSVITVEHNNREDRFRIKNILERNGYFCVHENLCKIEYWFVSQELFEEFFTVSQ